MMFFCPDLFGVECGAEPASHCGSSVRIQAIVSTRLLLSAATAAGHSSARSALQAQIEVTGHNVLQVTERYSSSWITDTMGQTETAATAWPNRVEWVQSVIYTLRHHSFCL